jgi:hypothetical protein
MMQRLVHVLALSLVFLLAGCSWVKQTVAQMDWLCACADKQKATEALGPEQPQQKLANYFFYARTKHIRPTQTALAGEKVHHMCWYQAESDQNFETETDFEQALQANPGAIKTQSLYALYTPSTSLAKGLLQELEKQPALLQQSGFLKQPIILSSLDRLVIGQDALVTGVVPSLAALVYFAGQFAAPPDGDVGAAARIMTGQVSAEQNKNTSAQPNPIHENPVGFGSRLPKLGEEFSEFLNKNLKTYGITNPPESVLRLPLEIVAEYPCPEY